MTKANPLLDPVSLLGDLAVGGPSSTITQQAGTKMVQWRVHSAGGPGQ